MSSSGLIFPIEDLKRVFRKWFYLEDENLIDIAVAVYVANLFDSDPIWMLIIAPPSNTKTEILRAFDGHEDSFFISNLTPQTLVSGILKKKNMEEPSLLPRLNDKLVVLKEFTTVLSMRSENQQEILSQLREAYDGQYTKIFGNGKEINWKGRFGLIAACTPVYDKHYAVIGSMGERFLLYRIDDVDGQKMGLQARNIVGLESVMRPELTKSLHKFIDQFRDTEKMKSEFVVDISEDMEFRIISLACFVAVARCPVERDNRNRILYLPAPEGTGRLTKQFIQMGKALAIVNGKRTIDEDIYSTVKKIGLDLVPQQRLRVIETLWEMKALEVPEYWVATTDVADKAKVPSSTSKLLLEDLMTTGFLNRDRGEPEGGRPPWIWQINRRSIEYIGQADLF
jgi:hypothetical protein